MINARNLSQQLGGHWYGRYGTAPCPICQTERRRDQNALTLSDNENRLLAHCKKSGCDFHDIVAAAGFVHGTWKAPNPVAAAQRKAQAKEEANRNVLLCSFFKTPVTTIVSPILGSAAILVVV